MRMGIGWQPAPRPGLLGAIGRHRRGRLGSFAVLYGHGRFLDALFADNPVYPAYPDESIEHIAGLVVEDTAGEGDCTAHTADSSTRARDTSWPAAPGHRASWLSTRALSPHHSAPGTPAAPVTGLRHMRTSGSTYFCAETPRCASPPSHAQPRDAEDLVQAALLRAQATWPGVGDKARADT